MAKYRKKPVVIEAEQFLNSASIHEFCGSQVREPVGADYLEIETLEGVMKASKGDYIIKGVNGEYYPCKPDIFEKTYEVEKEGSMDFGKAIAAVKAGKKIARLGWNGKGMFVVYQKGYPNGIPCNAQTAEAWGLKEGDLFICNPYLQIKQMDGSHSMWVPSIGDVLAEDWGVVEV